MLRRPHPFDERFLLCCTCRDSSRASPEPAGLDQTTRVRGLALASFEPLREKKPHHGLLGHPASCQRLARCIYRLGEQWRMVIRATLFLNDLARTNGGSCPPTLMRSSPSIPSRKGYNNIMKCTFEGSIRKKIDGRLTALFSLNGPNFINALDLGSGSNSLKRLKFN